MPLSIIAAALFLAGFLGAAVAQTGGGKAPQVPIPDGTALGNVSGGTAFPSAITYGTGIFTWLQTPSSENLAAAVTNETGSGALVFGTSPTITTPAFSGSAGVSGPFAFLSLNDTNTSCVGGLARLTGSGSGGFFFQMNTDAGCAFGTAVQSLSITTTGTALAGTVTLTNIASDATHTDSTVCQDTTTHTLFSGSGAAGICLGTSSLRFKRDWSPLQPGINQVMALEPIRYRYKEGYGTSDRDLYGFAAEQVIDVLPDLVGLDAEGRPNSVDWAGMVPLLVRAVQDQQREVDALKRLISQR